MTGFLRGTATLALLAANLAVWGTAVVIAGIPKLMMPKGELRRRWILMLARIADRWAAANNTILDWMLPDTVWDIEGIEGLHRDGKYLIISNHRSWVDIFALFRAFHERVEFIRFFLKRQLIWFPIAGWGCWALEFPFMKRYSPEFLLRHPEKRGDDLVTTRRAAKRYARIPVAMLIFVEGTRFTHSRHAEQDSPYANLLRPRFGGLAHVLATIGPQLSETLDVTIAYPGHGVDIDVWSFVTGRVSRIVARVRPVEIPREFLSDSIIEQGPARDRFKEWVEHLWREKDALLSELE